MHPGTRTIVETCLRYLARPEERARIAARGFELFSADGQGERLRPALAELGIESPPAPVTIGDVEAEMRAALVEMGVGYDDIALHEGQTREHTISTPGEWHQGWIYDSSQTKRGGVLYRVPKPAGPAEPAVAAGWSDERQFAEQRATAAPMDRSARRRLEKQRRRLARRQRSEARIVITSEEQPKAPAEP